MENIKVNQNADFKVTMVSILHELAKKKLKQKFYKEFGYTPSLVSQWKSGTKKASFSQENKLIKIAVRLIEDYDKASESSKKERSDLLSRFSSLVSK